jgi:N,N-dimethylformamidase
MLPLTGYLDRISARPGETIGVKVSSTLAGPYAADLIRIIHADPNPDGPGLKYQDIPSDFAGAYRSRHQSVSPGSYGVIDAAMARHTVRPVPLNSLEGFVRQIIGWRTKPGLQQRMQKSGSGKS